MSAPSLFSPITLRNVEIRNRVWIAAMCQYSVQKGDGVPTDWHLAHLAKFAAGGAGLVISEASAVSPEGRISPGDTGIWNDDQVAAWSRITTLVRAQGAVPGIQLAHAGRKASTYAPWGHPGKHGSLPAVEGGWETVAPSAVSFHSPVYATPTALDGAGIEKVIEDFRAGARRALQAGFEVIEVHAAHGYLLHQFLSPVSNQRDDQYGGSLENRARLLLQIIEAIREVSADVPLIVRFSATDWVEGGWNPDDTATVAGWTRAAGADFFDISTGGNVSGVKIPIGPGYQVRFADHVKRAAGVEVGAVGLITQSAQAEQILASGQADVVLIAREALRDPHTPLRWARELGADDSRLWVPQYERAR